METVVKKLLEVVEHLTYSHTFRSEAAGNEARRLLGEARAALIEPAPADPEPAADAGTPTPAEAETPAEVPVAASSGVSVGTTETSDGV